MEHRRTRVRRSARARHHRDSAMRRSQRGAAALDWRSAIAFLALARPLSEFFPQGAIGRERQSGDRRSAFADRRSRAATVAVAMAGVSSRWWSRCTPPPWLTRMSPCVLGEAVTVPPPVWSASNGTRRAAGLLLGLSPYVSAERAVAGNEGVFRRRRRQPLRRRVMNRTRDTACENGRGDRRVKSVQRRRRAARFRGRRSRWENHSHRH